eukprot:5662160-Alexandrium_andersonii.AAC.1
MCIRDSSSSAKSGQNPEPSDSAWKRPRASIPIFCATSPQAKVALQHLGTVCSTWVWMSRSSTGRNEQN